MSFFNEGEQPRFFIACDVELVAVVGSTLLGGVVGTGTSPAFSRARKKVGFNVVRRSGTPLSELLLSTEDEEESACSMRYTTCIALMRRKRRTCCT